MKALLVGTAVLLGSGTAGPAEASEAFRRLTGPQSKAQFAGMELTDEVHWAYAFGRGGRLASTTLGRRGTGSWQVEKDALCLTDEAGKRECSDVWAAGTRVQLRREGVLPEEGILRKPEHRL
ncbi:hypothetical protein [Methylobacterium nigriterrae]|uniref:hypothetical protein n=1 Tax=Methylobacterium nigriterrae TaxID=3127512 RepID=UPI00301322AE